MSATLLSTKELAKAYGVSQQSVCNWVRKGLPVAKCAEKLKRKAYLFDPDKVRAWISKVREQMKRQSLKEAFERLDALQAQVDKMQSIFTKEDEERFKELDKELQEMDKKFADTFTPEMEAELNAELEKAEKELGDLI